MGLNLFNYIMPDLPATVVATGGPTVGFRRGAGGKVSFAGKTRWNYSNLLRGAAVAPSPASQGWAGE